MTINTALHTYCTIFRSIGKFHEISIEIFNEIFSKLFTTIKFHENWHLYTYSVIQKSSPLKLLMIGLLSLLVNLCDWKLPWLLPKHIAISTPILGH